MVTANGKQEYLPLKKGKKGSQKICRITKTGNKTKNGGYLIIDGNLNTRVGNTPMQGIARVFGEQ